MGLLDSGPIVEFSIRPGSSSTQRGLVNEHCVDRVVVSVVSTRSRR